MLDGREQSLIRVVLVDDSAQLHSAWSRLLARVPDMELAALVHQADDLAAVAESARPEVVVMDVNMPGGDPIEMMRGVVTRNPQIRFLVYSGRTERDIVERARAAGASGYIGKESDPKRVLAAIRAIAAGGTDFAGAAAG